MVEIVSRLLSALANPAVWLLMLAAFTAGDLRGGMRAREKCNTAALKSQVEALRRDQAVAAKALEAAQAEAAASSEIARANARIVEGFKNAPAGACSLSADDVRRLRAIR